MAGEIVSGQVKGQENPQMEEAIWREQEEMLMRSYYPEQVQILQTAVERICDQEDYEGSRIYDEYPDQTMLRRMSERALEKALDAGLEEVMELEEEEGQGELSAQGRPPMGPPPGRPPMGPPPGRPPMRPPHGRPPRRNPLRDLAEVLLYHEIGRRRCRFGRCR